MPPPKSRLSSTGFRSSKWSVLLLMVTGLLAAGCGSKPEEKVAELPPLVEVLSVQPESITPHIQVTGSVVSQNVARVHPETSGTVLEVKVREGDSVETGEVLAELDPETWRLERQIAEAELKRASAEYEKLVNGFRPEDILAARSSYQNAAASLRMVSTNMERNRNLFSSGAMTERDWTVYLQELEAAEAMVRQRSAEWLKYQRGYDPEDIRSASAALLLARGREALAARNLRKTRLLAPLTGVVSKRMLEPGQLVNEGQEVFEVQDPLNVWLRVEVGERNSNRVRKGLAASIRSAPDQPVQEGFVDRVGRVLHPDTRTLPLWLAWKTPTGIPPVGSFAVADIRLPALPEVFRLERKWVFLYNDQHMVWTVNDGVLERKTVALGEDLGESVVVTAGLAGGDQVVISPPHQFEDGLEVRIEGLKTSAPAPAQPMEPVAGPNPSS